VDVVDGDQGNNVGKEETVRIWIRQKKLPAIRIGRDYLIDLEDIREFLKKHRTDWQSDTEDDG
jgi:excisionase family DNA binding protein